MSCRIKILAALLWLVVFVAQAEMTNWFDGFETGAGTNWTTNSVWKVGSPSTGPAVNSAGYRTHSGSRCATTGLGGNAPSNADSRLVCMHYINGQTYLTVPDASLYPRLRFWQWFDFVNAQGFVEVRQQNSTNWNGTNWLTWQTVSATNMSVGSVSSVGGG